LFPGKLLFGEITLLLNIPAKYSRQLTLSLCFPANYKKPTERPSFSSVTMETNLLDWGLNPQLSDHKFAISIELRILD
jgi:hypothetical protein